MQREASGACKRPAPALVDIGAAVALTEINAGNSSVPSRMRSAAPVKSVVGSMKGCR
jgi:hypothetical protein